VISTPGEYLVQYGRPAFVGRFVAACGPLVRGDRVLIHSARGVECGTVLCESAASFGATVGRADGDVIRRVGRDDLSRLEKQVELGAALIATAERLAGAAGMPVAVLDAEVLYDGIAAVLHVVAWGEVDLTPILDALGRELGLTVLLHDSCRAPVAKDGPESHGCGKPGCGSEGGGCTSCRTGGCSTGNCSHGSVKSADELTAYFADLRSRMERMEAHARLHRTPLN
jgi:hypothetical protein